MKKFRKIMAVLVAAMMIISSFTLTAFADPSYTITYYANGGSGSIEQQTTNSDMVTLTRNNGQITRDYHTFVRWNTQPDGHGTSYEDGQQIRNLTESLTLYAVWNKNDVTVSYDANGGTGTIAAQNVLHGNDGTSTYNACTFSRTGYSFAGWNIRPDGSGTSYAVGAFIDLNEDTILYAQWNRLDVTVTFDGNSAIEVTMPDQMLTAATLIAGTAKLNKNTYKRDSYKFIGWNTQADGSGAPFADEAIVDWYENDILYAQWSPEYANLITVQNGKKGETYNLYKMLDLNVDDQEAPTAYQYVLNGTAWDTFWTTGAGATYADVNNVGTKKYVVWKSTDPSSAEKEAFGKAAKKYAEDNHLIPDDTKTLTGDTNFTFGNLDNGYYLLTTSYGLAASVASTPANPEQVLKEKNNADDAEKKVKEAEERNGTAAGWTDANDTEIGKTIEYRTKVEIAYNSYNVKYHDKMDDGLSWSGKANTKVYTNEAMTTELSTEHYQVEESLGPETFIVTFKDSYISTLTEKPHSTFWIGYTAVLNDNVVVGESEVNTGWMTWGNAGVSVETSTKTDTHYFELLKFDKAGSENEPIAGAEFQLFTTASDGTALTLAKNGAGNVYRVVDMTDSGATLPTGFTLTLTNTIVTLASETIIIEGVDSDSYWLEETKAPLGFEKSANRIPVTIDGMNKVVNSRSTKLPDTGGMGTTVLYIVGGMLVILAGAYLFFSRKRTA